MNKIFLPDNKSQVLNKTSQNLGINQNSPGSYLTTVVDGLYELNASVTEEINETLSDLYVETAKESTLELFGAKKGIPRLKNKNITANAGDNLTYLRPVFYRPNTDLTFKIFTKNQIIKADIYLITFLEDVVYNSNFEKVYVSCAINLNPIYELTYEYVGANSIFKLEIPRQLNSLISELTFEVEKDIYFSSYNETVISYRDRIKKALRTQNISGESYILTALDGMPYVDQFYKKEETYPTSIFVLNNLMYKNKAYDELLDTGTLSLGNSLIDQVRSYGSNFKLFQAKRVTLSLDIEMDLASNFKSFSYFEKLPEYIYTKHVLGENLIIDKNLILNFLEENNIYEYNFKFKIYLYYNGISILNDIENFLVLKKEEFPTIISITYNGSDITIEGDSYVQAG